MADHLLGNLFTGANLSRPISTIFSQHSASFRTSASNAAAFFCGYGSVELNPEWNSRAPVAHHSSQCLGLIPRPPKFQSGLEPVSPNPKSPAASSALGFPPKSKFLRAVATHLPPQLAGRHFVKRSMKRHGNGDPSSTAALSSDIHARSACSSPKTNHRRARFHAR